METGKLYRRIWRWHFYAGLIVIPFIIILSITGAIYLFKPQIEHSIQQSFKISAEAAPKLVSQQVNSALKAVPKSKLRSYQLPATQNLPAIVSLFKDGKEILVYVNPYSLEVLKIAPKENKLNEIVKNIHGELLMGKNGSYIVEIAASWAIVMIITGLYLWWPRNAKNLGGILYPRKGKFVKDLHAVTGFWFSFFALFLLLTGLPWTEVWGDGFKEVRKITHTEAKSPQWTMSRQEENKELHDEMMHDTPYYLANIDDIAGFAYSKNMAYPTIIMPPNAKSKNWKIKSDAQNRMLREEFEYDAMMGSELNHTSFKDRHIIDKTIGVGISIHEGQLFGVLNQILGLLTALGLITLSVTSIIMWQKRAPKNVLGAPPFVESKLSKTLIVIIIGMGMFLPLLGATIIFIALLDQLIFRSVKPIRQYLGLKP